MKTARLILMIALLSMLTACASWKPRSAKPEPPQIDCAERIAPDPLPAIPKLPPLPAAGASDQALLRYVRKVNDIWIAHSLRLVGRWESVVTQRMVTADCLDRERAAGRIR